MDAGKTMSRYLLGAAGMMMLCACSSKNVLDELPADHPAHPDAPVMAHRPPPDELQQPLKLEEREMESHHPMKPGTTGMPDHE